MESPDKGIHQQITRIAHLDFEKKNKYEQYGQNTYAHETDRLCEFKLGGKAVAIDLSPKIDWTCDAGAVIAEIRNLDNDFVGVLHNIQREYDILVVL